MPRLKTGDQFPTLTADTVQGEKLHLPDDLTDQWAVTIFYRGDW
jgi:alkyl hydroperoxide reductase subunit AhpC